ncbi:MAG TPA: hypothetical protein VF377_08870 [Acidimicrobiia bacterium]
MPSTVTVTRRELLEEALAALYRAAERPAVVEVGAVSLNSEVDTELTLARGELAVGDVVEHPSSHELMLVTKKSSDSTPKYTVLRSYLGSTASGPVGAGEELLKNPTWTRLEVSRWIDRALGSVMNTELPFVEVAELAPHPLYKYIELPEDTLNVVRVRHFSDVTGEIAEIGGWSFEEVPTSVVPSGKALRIRPYVDDTLIVDMVRPYSWEGDGEEATVELPLPARDIPVLWAAAYGASRREISRAELDKIEEWNQEQAIRAGVNLRVVRDAWAEVYRRIDEARRVHRVPKHRPFRKRPKVW